LQPVKGYDIAVEAVALLAKRLPKEKFRYVLIGEGPEETNLKKLAEQRGCRDSFVFRPSTPAPWDVYSGLDFFVLPSREEGLPLTLIEAMASGSIPIATKVGGMPEVISDPSLGWLVPPESIDALAKSMYSAFEYSSESRAAIAGRVREHAKAHFDVVNWKQAFANLIER
jgi:glycosyltransferase involved in cell wall biosynthesis